MTEVGGGGKPLRAGLAIARSGATPECEDRQREHRVAVAARRRQAIPFCGALIVLRDAKTVRVKLAEKRHGLGIGRIRYAVGGERESGEKIAALEGAINEIGWAPRLRRRWRRHGALRRRRLGQPLLRRRLVCRLVRLRRARRGLRESGLAQAQRQNPRRQSCDHGLPHPAHLTSSLMIAFAAATASAAPSGCDHIQSPSAMKSAPVRDNGGTSSLLAA